VGGKNAARHGGKGGFTGWGLWSRFRVKTQLGKKRGSHMGRGGKKNGAKGKGGEPRRQERDKGGPFIGVWH